MTDPRIRLPVDEVLPEVTAALRDHGAVVLHAPPGSGKTTRVPQALVDDLGGEGEIVVLEPRRVAARAAARRVASERGSEVGAEVGFQVRDERKVSRATRIRFATEGVLVRQLCDDPFLERTRAVVLDEFHERHVDTDLALSMVQEIRETVRDDLAVVVMSATLDPGPIQEFLGGCPVVVAEGRPYPVDIVHETGRDDRDVEARAADTTLRALEESPGDVLVFLPGVREIEQTGRMLRSRLPAGVEVLPLHGSLPSSEQDRALRASKSGRRIVLSTNVAESSVTVEGVTAVVDTGLARIARFDPSRGLDQLRVERIALDAATQRSGRAGRMAPGRCYRLWALAEERGMAPETAPEVRRADLTGSVLAVHQFAGRDAAGFRWFERPQDGRLEQADTLLRELGCLDDRGTVTDRGRRVSALPLHPRLATAILRAGEIGGAATLCGVAAIVAERPLGDERRLPLDVFEQLGLLRDVEERRFDARACEARGLRPGPCRAVAKARDDLLRRCRVDRRDARRDEHDAAARALLAGFPDRVGSAPDPSIGEGVLADGRGVRWRTERLALEGSLFLALRVGEAGGAAGGLRASRSDLRLCCEIEPAWLEEVEGGLVERVDAELDSGGRIVAIRRRRFFDLVLEENRGGGRPDPEAVVSIVTEALRKDPRPLYESCAALRSVRERLDFLRSEDPDGDWPELGVDELLGLAGPLLGDLRSLGGLSKLSLVDLVFGAHGGLRARLQRQAPEKVQLPSGRHAKIDYSGEQPVVAARLQEWFGQRATPSLLSGRYPLLLHLLAPNHRPVQITRDLPSFWNNHYDSVRSELRRRYPKHSWPEDPWAATPESRPKRRRR